MEKFGAFRDSGTGIAPFLVVKPARVDRDAASAVLAGLRDYLVGSLLLFPLRLVLLLLGLLIMLIGDLLSLLFGVLGASAAWGSRRAFYVIGARIVLFAMGFHYIPFEVVSTRKGRRDASAPAEDLRAPPITSSTLLVVNHSSYVDLFYLAYAFTPSYYLYPSGTGKETVVPRTFWKALALVATDPSALWAAKPTEQRFELSEVRAQLWSAGPLALFPEATTTNGKGLLRFLGTDPESSSSALLESCHVEGAPSAGSGVLAAYVVGLKYEYETFAPTIPLGSRLLHLARLMCQYGNFLSVAHTPPSSVSASLFSQPSPVNQTDLASMVLGRILSQRRTGLDARKKADFLSLYEGKKGGPAKREKRM
ncbi:hypothetical protein DFJ74DRAFT_659735 [Hyaloraphidium curvatum]|nr:hypothetical protein DFJ74DRAFT_659735 [Hyaloraphidium curvatum]